MRGLLPSLRLGSQTDTAGTRKSRDNVIILIHAYANKLQQYLRIPVLVCEFYHGGRGMPVREDPSSLVTIHPYCAGGERRLVLNKHHALIAKLARSFAAATTTSISDTAAAVALEFGKALVWTCSWPIHVDCEKMIWKNAKGLICGPHWNMLVPVPHDIINGNEEQLAIWPLRIYAIFLKENRKFLQSSSSEQTPSSHSTSKSSSTTSKRITKLGEKWTRRDELLQIEWDALTKNKKTKHGKKTCSGPHRQHTSVLTGAMGFITYAPSLPILLLAQYLQEQPNNNRNNGRSGDCFLAGRIRRSESLQVAAKILLSVDKLFCLSVFFGVPLMDRTRTLKSSIRVDQVVAPPPSLEEIQTYSANLVATDAVGALKETMLERARALWKKQPQRIFLCWSGGIDSTAALVCLLQTRPVVTEQNQEDKHRRQQQLQVILDDVSRQENPIFWENHIRGKLTCIERQGRTLSQLAKLYTNNEGEGDGISSSILVTGELGDQLFGSDKCRQCAFPESNDDDDNNNNLTKEEERFMDAPEPNFTSLQAPWKEELLRVLEERGLLCGNTTSWIQFFEPQLARAAPFPIQTVYDMLWWLNFSCKWQTVSLRCLHDGGNYRPNNGGTLSNNIGAIHHFYNDRHLECWACVPEFHSTKFPNLSDWKTYKQPLKDIIYAFDGNRDYLENKKKVASLNFDLVDGSEQSDAVEKILGLVRTTNNHQGSSTITATTAIAELTSGMTSFVELSCDDLNKFSPRDGSPIQIQDFLEPWILESSQSIPPMSIPTITVQPWGQTSEQPSAFQVAAQFADTDERQRRIANPVTAITLHGKCSALLPPELVAGKTVLDIGACLGSMCHWSLYHGATHVTGVEPQPNFCKRMQQLLTDASSTWPHTPSTSSKEERFTVVCAEAREYLKSCKDNSFDIVVVAGVLHCFQDPIAVILELARVAKHSICIESVNTTYNLTGFQDTERAISPSYSSGLLELAPSACVNKAGADVSFTGLAVVPSELLVRNLMQRLGYDVLLVKLPEHPTHNLDVLTYTGCRRFHATPKRFFLRCTRQRQSDGETVPKLRSLEDCVVSVEGGERDWTSSRVKFWTSYDVTQVARHQHKSQAEEKKQDDNDNQLVKRTVTGDVMDDDHQTNDKAWEFDDAVARRFQREAESHIPDYKAVIVSCLEAISEHFSAESLSKLRVVDVGCAIGYTVLQMLKFGFRQVYGYDISSSMLLEAQKSLQEETKTSEAKWTSEHYNLFLADKATQVPSNVFSRNSLDAVIMNWTLHFLVQPEQRLSYLRQLFQTLKPGGLLILTEKTNQDDVTRELYYNWKASNPQNVSRTVIDAKRKKLKGVLETLPVQWYLENLRSCGYDGVTILRAKFGFVTFLCHKPSITPPVPAINAEPFLWWPKVESEAHLVEFDGTADPEPYALKAWGEHSETASIALTDSRISSFGYVHSGEATLSRTLRSGKFLRTNLVEGMYFCCQGCFEIEGGSGIISTVPSHGKEWHSTPFTIGGPLFDEEEEELKGRLPYIDGCTDSLLIPPVVKGAPCLNHLHFPCGISQTQHTHPSGRTGIVIKGQGVCHVVDPNGKTSVTELQPGTVFCIPRESPHAFETLCGQSLDVVAFHPDSDCGPSPTNHPMLNRTIIDGISAALLPAIHTKNRG